MLKTAAIFFGASIVTVLGFSVPVKSPDQLLNTNIPGVAVAVNCTGVPVSYQPKEGLTLPPTTGKMGRIATAK
jgi:hypothetical protein